MSGEALSDLTAKLRIDSSALEETQAKAKEFGSRMGETLKKGAEIGGVVYGLDQVKDVMVESVKGAIEMEHTQGRLKDAFGASAEEVSKFGENAAAALGMSADEADKASAKFGDMFSSLGVGKDQSAKMSTDLVSLSANLASKYGKTQEEMMSTLSSAETGRTKGLKQLGIEVTAADIKTQAARMGIVQSTVDQHKLAVAHVAVEKAQAALTAATKAHGAESLQAQAAAVSLTTAQDKYGQIVDGAIPKLNAAQTAQATYAVLMDKTRDSQDYLSKHQDEAGFALKRLGAMWDNTKDTIAEFILGGLKPVIAALPQIGSAIKTVVQPAIDGLRTAFDYLRDHMDMVKPILIGVAGAFGLVAAALGIQALIEGVTGAVAAMNVVLMANPIILIVIALAALGAAIAVAYTHVKGFHDGVDKVMKAVSQAFGSFVAYAKSLWPQVSQVVKEAMTAVSAIITGAVAAISWVWEHFGHQIIAVVSTAFNMVKDTISTVINVVKDVISLVLDLLTGKWGKAWGDMKNLVGDVFNGIKNLIGDALNGIIAFFRDLPSHILGAIGDLAGFLHDHVFKPVVDMISGIFSSAGNFIGGIGRGIASVVLGLVDSMVNTVIDQLDQIQIHAGLVNWDGLKLGHINLAASVPNMAEGGIVPATPGGKLINVAEAGHDEAIIPLDGKHGMGGQTINVYVTQSNATASQISRELGWALRGAS